MSHYPHHIGDSTMEPLGKKNAHIRANRLFAARLIASHTKQEWDAMLALFQGRCVQCWMVPEQKPQKDHIKPIYQGGSDGINNLQPLCRKCNASKGADSFDWASYRKQNSLGGF